MFETLLSLSKQTLPVTVTDRRQIDDLRMLDAAGYARVLIPPLHVDCDDCIRQDPATVLCITLQGWKILRAGSSHREDP